MSFALLIWMLAPQVVHAEAARAARPVAIPLSRQELAAEVAAFSRGRFAGREPARAEAVRAPASAASPAYDGTVPDLALKAGSRRMAQIELGALGGGRADAPGLVHVGVGFDF